MILYIGDFSEKPSTCVWFEPDYTVHPKKFQHRIDTLTRIGAESVWTNNPHFVDFFDPKNIFICKSGKPMLRMSEHPEWPKWEKELLPGEFWSLIME